MTSIKNRKTATILVTISTIAAVLMVAVGSGHMTLAASDNVTKNLNNTGINVQTGTDQKQKCDAAGETSPIINSCTATSNDIIGQSGGIHHK
jgi:hypothetical protein